MKKLTQHPKICNEENVPYLWMDNEDSFKVLSKNYFCVTVFIVCHSLLHTSNTIKNYNVCEHKLGRQTICAALGSAQHFIPITARLLLFLTTDTNHCDQTVMVWMTILYFILFWDKNTQTFWAEQPVINFPIEISCNSLFFIIIIYEFSPKKQFSSNKLHTYNEGRLYFKCNTEQFLHTYHAS